MKKDCDCKEDCGKNCKCKLGILEFTTIDSGVCPKCKKEVKCIDDLIDHIECYKS